MKSPNTLLETKHFPVMLDEVIKICSPKSGGKYLDCTFGGGSYSKELLKFPNTKIIAFDRDERVLDIADNLKKQFENRFKFYHNKFSNIDQIPISGVDAVIFDLGISSIQLNDLSRGFSFKSKDRLDMSMGLASTSAQEVLNDVDQNDLKMILKIFGEEKEASIIAKNIIKVRSIKKLKSVNELVDIIEESKKKNFKKKINLSTKTFQALRIFVNKEISELIEGIIKATKILKPGGKLIVLSFHSLEDKIVKFYFKNFSSNHSRKNKYLPDANDSAYSLFETYKNKVLTASEKELQLNIRSRSAKLRVATRNKNIFKEPNALRFQFKKLTDLEKKYG